MTDVNNDLMMKRQVLAKHVEPILQDLLHNHFEGQYVWYPDELLPAHDGMTRQEEVDMSELFERSQALPDAARIALILNMLTEEGLPTFHRMITEAFGKRSDWFAWSNQWTAEEDKHGTILGSYLRHCRLVNMRAVEKLQYHYLQTSWDPDWAGDPYCTLAYTSFQEKATQVSHVNIGKLVHKIEPTITKILSRLSGDELRHYRFYSGVMRVLLQVDTERALNALLHVLKVFTMPGANIPGFDALSHVEHALGVFGPKEFASVIDEVLVYLGVPEMDDLPPHLEATRQKIMAYPERLRKLDLRFKDKVTQMAKDAKIDLVNNRPIILDFIN